VMAHTGAVAGSVEACDAALRAAGAIQVGSLDELIETAVLVAGLRAAPKRAGVGVLSLSGGEIALALDAAAHLGVELPLSNPVKEEVARLLPKFAHISNPLDLTWAGLYDPEVARGCARTLGAQADVGMLVLLQDAPKGLGVQQAGRYSRLLTSVAAGALDVDKSLVAVSNLSGEIHPELAQAAQTAGVPYLRGTQEGFAAIARYARWATAPVSATEPNPRSRAYDAARQQLADLPAGRIATETEARQVLAAYGVPGPRELLVSTPQQAALAAAEIGFPAVLKCLVAGMVHKSDAGLVEVGLRSAEEIVAAATRMLDQAARLSEGRVLGLLVQEKVSAIAELLVGGRADPEFGPLIVVGAGGVLVELYRDVAVRVAPLDEEGALEALSSTHASRLLDGFRGRARGDKQAAARIVSAVSHFIADFGKEIAEVEVNPLAVMAEGQGCSALDCVLIAQCRAGAARTDNDAALKHDPAQS